LGFVFLHALLIFVDALEQLVRDRDQRDVETHVGALPRSHTGSSMQNTVAFNILSLLARELPRLVNSTPSTREFSDDSRTTSSKRRRVEGSEEDLLVRPRELDGAPELPCDDILELIICAYFSHIHHWIPMVHQGRYRQRMDEPDERRKLHVLTRAIALAASKHVHDERMATFRSAPPLRNWIVSTALSELSVENVQALIIVAFDDVSCLNNQILSLNVLTCNPAD
jgi:hypothetical protein